MYAIILAVLMGILHFFSEDIYVKYFQKHYAYIMSFTAGASITYLLTHLIPDIIIESIKFNLVQNKIIFVYLLAGFVVFHLLEKYVYQHVRSKMLIKDLKEIHFIALFLYHFLIGILLVYFSNKGLFNSLVFIIPVAMILTLQNISLHNIHKPFKESNIIKITGSVSTLIGALTAYFTTISSQLILSGNAFIAGSLMFIVIRETIPPEKEGKAIAFITGIIVYTLILYSVNLIY